MDREGDISDGRGIVKFGATAAFGGILGIASYLYPGGSDAFALGVANTVMPLLLDYAERKLSPRETERIDYVTYLSIQEIKSHLDKGHLPRTDGFFSNSINVNSSASELWEGVCEIARTEHERSKLEFIAYLNASFPFVTVSRGEANRLIYQLEVLTYRKLCILATISQKDTHQRFREQCLSNKEGSDELGDVMQDCLELEQIGLLQESCGQAPHYGTHTWLSVVPSHLSLTKYGKRLVELGRLYKIPKANIEQIYVLMREQDTFA